MKQTFGAMYIIHEAFYAGSTLSSHLRNHSRCITLPVEGA